MKKYFLGALLLVSFVVMAKHYRWWTDNNVLRPHTIEWANYVIKTEMNNYKSDWKRGDFVYLIYDRKVTVMKFELSTSFIPVTLGVSESGLREDHSRLINGDETVHQASSGRTADHESIIREIDRRYDFLRGRVNDRCDGTTTRDDCDR